jgi:hypothetical protein
MMLKMVFSTHATHRAFVSSFSIAEKSGHLGAKLITISGSVIQSRSERMLIATAHGAH